MYLLPAISSAFVAIGFYLLVIRSKTKASLVCLFAAAFVLRWWMAGLDPFLHEWDERYHALVAKNMMSDPFRPMLLVHPHAGFDYTLWCCNQIWLHKPPLFLWQMALSMKLFGVALWSVRLPSVLMGALLVFPIFRLGTLLRNVWAGFFAAALFVFAGNHLEQVAGQVGMEHNDVAFSFYVTLSFWAFAEMLSRRDSVRWSLAIGLFAGAAVLCKWLAGLLIFGAWGLDLALHQNWIQRLRPFLWGLGTALLVFMPWNIYIHWRFPQEASFEQQFNTRHIFEVVEGHYGGGWNYYLSWFNQHYGNWTWVLLLLGFMAVMYTQKQTNQRVRNALLFALIVVYGFFSLVAQTKIPSYVYFVAPLMYVMMGVGMDWVFSGRSRLVFNITTLGTLLMGCYATFSLGKIRSLHLQPSGEVLEIRQNRIHDTNVFRKLEALTPVGASIYLCAGDVEAMFFCNRDCYPGAPSPHEVDSLLHSGKPVALFYKKDVMENPDFKYLLDNQTQMILIREKLRR